MTIVAFFPEASFGAALNCVGIAQELRREGATPVFICHPGFTGVFANYGFKEYHLPDPGKVSDDRSRDYWQDFINTHVPHFNQDALAQLTTYVAPTWEAIVDTAMEAEEGLEALLDQIRPDVIALDNVIMFPAILRAGVPWVRVVSCAETEIPDANVPPYLSGLAPDAPERAAFEAAYLKATKSAHRRYNAFRKRRGLAALPEGIFLELSPHQNLLLSPEPARYTRAQPLDPATTTYLEGCVRAETRFDPPALPADEGPLVYMSFGSLGAIDTDTIARMIAAFDGLPARFMVNVGGFLESYGDVPDNVFLADWFPQPSVVADSDLIIHHGGNNSYCEALYFGVPSLVIPYCWDGHDNAERARATGTGLRLNRCDLSAPALRAAITELLADSPMRDRLRAISERMQANPGTRAAAKAILSTV